MDSCPYLLMNYYPGQSLFLETGSTPIPSCGCSSLSYLTNLFKYAVIVLTEFNCKCFLIHLLKIMPSSLAKISLCYVLLQADSGGPLMVKNGMNMVVVGIVSTGIGCARASLPGIYTRLTEYVNWIALIINQSTI